MKLSSSNFECNSYNLLLDSPKFKLDNYPNIKSTLKDLNTGFTVKFPNISIYTSSQGVEFINYLGSVLIMIQVKDFPVNSVKSSFYYYRQYNYAYIVEKGIKLLMCDVYTFRLLSDFIEHMYHIFRIGINFNSNIRLLLKRLDNMNEKLVPYGLGLLCINPDINIIMCVDFNKFIDAVL